MKSWNIIGQIMGTVTLVYFRTGALYIIVTIGAVDIVVSLHVVILIYRRCLVVLKCILNAWTVDKPYE